MQTPEQMLKTIRESIETTKVKRAFSEKAKHLKLMIEVEKVMQKMLDDHQSDISTLVQEHISMRARNERLDAELTIIQKRIENARKDI